LGLNMVVERIASKVSTLSLNGAMKETRETDRQPRVKTEKVTFHTDVLKVVIC